MEKLFSPQIIFLILLVVIGEVLGNVFGLYRSLAAFDIVTHFVGGALACHLAIKYLKQKFGKTTFTASVLITMGIGALWEIIEFFADLLFGLKMQGSLNDTMVDLIMVSSAAIIVNLLNYLTQKK